MPGSKSEDESVVEEADADNAVDDNDSRLRTAVLNIGLEIAALLESGTKAVAVAVDIASKA